MVFSYSTLFPSLFLFNNFYVTPSHLFIILSLGLQTSSVSLFTSYLAIALVTYMSHEWHALSNGLPMT